MPKKTSRDTGLERYGEGKATISDTASGVLANISTNPEKMANFVDRVANINQSYGPSGIASRAPIVAKEGARADQIARDTVESEMTGLPMRSRRPLPTNDGSY